MIEDLAIFVEDHLPEARETLFQVGEDAHDVGAVGLDEGAVSGHPSEGRRDVDLHAHRVLLVARGWRALLRIWLLTDCAIRSVIARGRD